MDLGLEGKVCLVTGATRGIGRAIAEAPAAEGARVAIAARSQAGVGEVAQAIGGRGYVFDSGDLPAIDPLVDGVAADLGAIDVYVVNTGGPPRFEDPLAPTAQEWEAAHRSLVVSPMLLMRRVVPGMRSRGFGRVVAVSSSAAREPIDGLQLSNVNRPGLLAGMKLLARECAADGVTFNAVLPGRIATDRIARATAGWTRRRLPRRPRSRRAGSARRGRPPTSRCSCARRGQATSPRSPCSSTAG